METTRNSSPPAPAILNLYPDRCTQLLLQVFMWPQLQMPMTHSAPPRVQTPTPTPTTVTTCPSSYFMWPQLQMLLTPLCVQSTIRTPSPTIPTPNPNRCIHLSLQSFMCPQL